MTRELSYTKNMIQENSAKLKTVSKSPPSGNTTKEAKEKLLKTTEEYDCERRGYKLTKNCLGTGAYAKVKLAYVTNAKLEKDKRLAAELKEKGTNKVAIKIISRKTAPKEYINKFMPREIETLRVTYKFPHLTQLYETFRTDNRVYLIMEYASKGDLLEYINSRSSKQPGIGERKAKLFFTQMVAGVEHCHKRNVVHRDLKCENILIEEAAYGEEQVKITDFGFATRFPTNKQSFLETFCGSYAYAAPEILKAEKYDGKIADIWSLGIILFAMLNGRLPYNDRNIRNLIEQTKARPRFSNRVTITPDCVDLVNKILIGSISKRATLQDILSHPWMHVKNPSQDKISRGIPDGKSKEVVSDDEEQYRNINDCKKVTPRVLNRERIEPEPKAKQKLLHSRPPKCILEGVKPEAIETKTETVLTKFWEAKKVQQPSNSQQTAATGGKTNKNGRPLITSLLPNKYQPEPVVTKIDFNGMKFSGNDKGVGYRLSTPNKKIIKGFFTEKCNQNAAEGKWKNVECSLPPVFRGNKPKSNSAPLTSRSPQTENFEASLSSRKGSKGERQTVQDQYQSKPIKNFSFNQAGVNVQIVNLRQNWKKLKQASSTSPVPVSPTHGSNPCGRNGGPKDNNNNIELTYYMLSGKEVNMKDEKRKNLKPKRPLKNCF